MTAPHTIPPEATAEQLGRLVQAAQAGDRNAFGELVETWRRPLFGYIYRMVTHGQDAEDLLQEVVVRTLEGIRGYRGEAPFKSWLFGIATHVCLDHLRKKKRWRVEAQLVAEQEAEQDSEYIEGMQRLASQPGFRFEIREHIAFCFSCIARTLEPEQQAAILLREVLGFTNPEAARILSLSEPVFRHTLSAARGQLNTAFVGLCQLINKTGACWQCRGLREFFPAGHRGKDLVQIQVKPGLALTAENLLDARLEIVRDSDLAGGASRTLHDLFYTGISAREESRT